MYVARMTMNNTEFVFALLAAANRIETRLNRGLSCVKGISYTEYYMLKQLKERHNGAATRVDLARSVHLTPSAVTRALKPLEKIGFVVTQKGERDARQSVATLTSAGEELLNDANSLVADEIDSMSIPDSVRAELTDSLAALSPK